MSIKAPEDLQGMTTIAQIVGKTLKEMTNYARPGISTKKLDNYGYQILKDFGANPAPKKEYGFPGYNCISVNHIAAHGIPSEKVILKEGDLVNIDVSAELDGYFGDNGGSFVLGNDFQNLTPLVNASKEVLHAAIGKIKGGVKIASLGAFIEKEAKQRGFTTIKNLVGHGIGLHLHETPLEIPNFYDNYNRGRFKKDTVIALETFISTKPRYVNQLADGWSLYTPNNGFVAQHEHTLIVTDAAPIILTQNNGI